MPSGPAGETAPGPGQTGSPPGWSHRNAPAPWADQVLRGEPFQDPGSPSRQGSAREAEIGGIVQEVVQQFVAVGTFEADSVLEGRGLQEFPRAYVPFLDIP